MSSDVTSILRFIELILLIFMSSLPDMWCIPIDNGVIGPPTVECSDSGINFNVNTRNPFNGRIFIKGEVNNKVCVKEYGGAGSFNTQSSTRAAFFVLFDRCGMTRLRMLNPRGMMQSVVIVVSFHPLFITKVDKAYRVQCFYGEIEKTLTAILDVSMLPTEDLTDNMRMPRCTYSIHRQRPDGPEIRFSQIGDAVVHKWQCDQADMYRFLVKNCYVEDGEHRPIQVIDESGCVLDPILLGAVNYSPSVPYVYAESHVFKFADKSNLNFICQIQICLIMAGGCSQLLPPRCRFNDNTQVGGPAQPGSGVNGTATTGNFVPVASENFPPGGSRRFVASGSGNSGGSRNFIPHESRNFGQGGAGPFSPRNSENFVPPSLSNSTFIPGPGSSRDFQPGSSENFGSGTNGRFLPGRSGGFLPVRTGSFAGNNPNGRFGNGSSGVHGPVGNGFNNDTTQTSLPRYTDAPKGYTDAPREYSDRVIRNDAPNKTLHFNIRDSPLKDRAEYEAYRKRRQTHPGPDSVEPVLAELDVQRDIVALDADDDLKHILEAGFAATKDEENSGNFKRQFRSYQNEDCVVGPIGLAIIVGTLSSVALLLTVAMCAILLRRNKGLTV